MPVTASFARRVRRAGFTLTELLIVIGLIVVLLGLLLPTLGGVWSTGALTKSMNNLRQVGTWMRQYSADHNDAIVPSRFDNRGMPYPGKVRSAATEGLPGQGTWADVLHTAFEVGAYPDAVRDYGHDYATDSPDRKLYDLAGDGIRNPFRSAAENTRNWNGDPGDELPKPYGRGAQEKGYPGFFAANNFFDAGWNGTPGAYFANGQIRYPDQSMYLVDSYLGEIIETDPARWLEESGDVDFRYANGSVCLMLLLDGHAAQMSPWENLCELEGDPDNLEDTPGRGVRIRALDQRNRLPCD